MSDELQALQDDIQVVLQKHMAVLESWQSYDRVLTIELPNADRVVVRHVRPNVGFWMGKCDDPFYNPFNSQQDIK